MDIEAKVAGEKADAAAAVGTAVGCTYDVVDTTTLISSTLLVGAYEASTLLRRLPTTAKLLRLQLLQLLLLQQSTR